MQQGEEILFVCVGVLGCVCVCVWCVCVWVVCVCGGVLVCVWCVCVLCVLEHSCWEIRWNKLDCQRGP